MPDDSVKAFFDGKAKEREWEFASIPVLAFEHRRRQRALGALAAPAAGEMVLDLGCGNLLDYPVLGREGCAYFGVDVSEAMLREGVRRFPECAGRVVVADARRLPFRKQSLDKVITSELLEHVPGYEAVFDEMETILAPGGTLVVTTPNRRSLYGLARWLWERKHTWEHPFDRWKTRKELVQQLERTGITVRASRGACYLPAILGRAVPLRLQKLMVAAVSIVEPVLARLVPGLGYIVAVRGVKRRCTSCAGQ